MQTALRKLQLTELEILKKTLQLFEENNITYFALGGTLLGAVRHQGFIPWDDDIDLGVPREDYDRLPTLLKAENIEFSAFQSDETHFCYFLRIIDPKIKIRDNMAQNENISSA